MKAWLYRGITLQGVRGRWLCAAFLGGVTLRINNTVWAFRPPWNKPMFSERNGHVRHFVRFAGWRVFRHDHSMW